MIFFLNKHFIKILINKYYAINIKIILSFKGLFYEKIFNKQTFFIFYIIYNNDYFDCFSKCIPRLYVNY